MKVAVCLLVMVLVVSIEAMPNADSHVRSKRGFRMGAADRFSHGFGKRGGDSIDSLTGVNDNFVMTTEDLVDLLQSNPKLAVAFVQRYLDINGDGVISRQELLEGSRK